MGATLENIILFNRRKYLNPKIDVEIVFLESSIAAGSSTVTVGNTGNNHSPFIEDWENGGTRTSDFDI